MRGLSVVLVLGRLAVPLKRNVSESPTLLLFLLGHKTFRKNEMKSPSAILETHYSLLPITPGFKRFFAIHKIENLEGLLSFKTKELLTMRWFTERQLKEYIDLLDDHGLLEKLN